MKSSTLVTRPTAWDRRSMTRYTRHQLIVLLVLLGAAGLGLAVGHWRRAHPDLSDRLEQFERTPRPASPLAPPAPVSSAPQRQPSSQALIDLNRANAAELTRLRSEEHTSELQSPYDLVCRLLLEKKNKNKQQHN